jgi:hypothetical protein
VRVTRDTLAVSKRERQFVGPFGHSLLKLDDKRLESSALFTSWVLFEKRLTLFRLQSNLLDRDDVKRCIR